MNSLTITCLAVAALLLPGSLNSSRAQGIGYAQAIDRLGTSRGKDIEKFCKKANLGGGRVPQYPDQNRTAASSSCKASEAVGFGEEQVFKLADPEAAENRRVQLINVSRSR